MKTKVIDFVSTFLHKNKTSIDTTERLLMTSLPYYLLGITIIACCFALEHHPFVFIITIHMIFPFLDEIFSLDWKNPTPQQRSDLEENNFWFKFALYFTVISDWILFIRMMNIFVTY